MKPSFFEVCVHCPHHSSKIVTEKGAGFKFWIQLFNCDVDGMPGQELAFYNYQHELKITNDVPPTCLFHAEHQAAPEWRNSESWE